MGHKFPNKNILRSLQIFWNSRFLRNTFSKQLVLYDFFSQMLWNLRFQSQPRMYKTYLLPSYKVLLGVVVTLETILSVCGTD